MKIPDIAIGAIIGALIAATVALLTILLKTILFQFGPKKGLRKDEGKKHSVGMQAQ